MFIPFLALSLFTYFSVAFEVPMVDTTTPRPTTSVDTTTPRPTTSVDTTSKNTTSEDYSYVDTVDLQLYDGFWYEVYKDLFDDTFQIGGSCVTANYTIWNDGNVGIVNCELLPNGEFSFIDGYAYYDDGNSGGELTVKLDGVNQPAPYWIVELGPLVDDQYDYAIVSDNVKFGLFVLARDVERFFKLYDDDVLTSLETMGFNNVRNKPIKTNQSSSCRYI